jgi:sulfite exporter TauE/SafE
MSLLPDIPNPYLAALIGGLIYGLAVCTSACLPYVTSYIAGIGASFRKGVTVTMIFNLGRITGYALIGAALGMFKYLVSDEFLTSFQKYSSFAFSLVTVAIGISILLKNRTATCNCDLESKTNSGIERISKFDVRAFSLGLSRGLLICTPLLMLLLYTVPFAAPIDSLFLAVLFGTGTALSPMLLLGGATGWLLNKAPLLRRWISIFGGGLLMALGILTLITTIKVI